MHNLIELRQLLLLAVQHPIHFGTNTTTQQGNYQNPHNQLRKLDKEYLTPFNKPIKTYLVVEVPCSLGVKALFLGD
jgi:hypothetical protein